MIPANVKTRRGTCGICHKVRKLSLHGSYYFRCGECYELTDDEARVKRDEALRNREPKPRFAYPCVGGPLDGEYATTEDFRTWGDNPGMYTHLTREYHEYNYTVATRKRVGSFPPSMIFIHVSLLKPLARPRDR